MTVYLIKTDGTKEEFNNVTQFTASKIVCKAGRGIMTIFAGPGEYFTTKSEE